MSGFDPEGDGAGVPGRKGRGGDVPGRVGGRYRFVLDPDPDVRDGLYINVDRRNPRFWRICFKIFKV